MNADISKTIKAEKWDLRFKFPDLDQSIGDRELEFQI